MTELEKMQRAKEYMDMLADGIDPISGKALDNDSALNNVRLSRCFFYVSDILRQIIENGGISKKVYVKQADLPAFSMPQELRDKVEITKSPAMIRQFTERLNDLSDLTAMKKLSPTTFTSWLLNKGFLFEETFNGRKRKKPTKSGLSLGIMSEEREGLHGGYTATLYSENAQKFLIDNLDEILAVLQ
ncbi:MAG: hypothetical protein FWG69_02480 [Oscillospiraceae bacterium]|nr:hypothetical protein [Oscillospiraceae bacterium]